MGGRKSFYCSGWWCGNGLHPVSEIAQELKGKTLCKTCYNAGYRLKEILKVVKERRDN